MTFALGGIDRWEFEYFVNTSDGLTETGLKTTDSDSKVESSESCIGK